MTDRRIIFFDGDCLLCNRFASQLAKLDKQHRLFFAPLQGDTAQRLLPEHLRNLDTMVYRQFVKTSIASTAIIESMVALGGFWRSLIVLKWIPVRFRDYLYMHIAKRRYQLCGHQDLKDSREWLNERLLP